MINFTLDWDDAKKVAVDTYSKAIKTRTRHLKDYKEAYGEESVTRYLPTHYFDGSGYRYSDLEILLETNVVRAREVMISWMVSWTTQKNLFGEEAANSSFEQFKKGQHDT